MACNDGRPTFPDQWQTLDITLDDLNLAHTLPVGQTFLWHRQPIRREGMSNPLQNVSVKEEIVQDVKGVSIQEIPLHEPLVKVEHVEEELQTIVKQEPADPLQVIKPEPSFNGSTDAATPNFDPEPPEEWSRAIPHPSRIILLRQTPSRIYYTSIPVATSPPPEADRAYLLDLFNVGVTASHGNLAEVYAMWAAADPLLFGKAWRAEGVPRGVRVLRQDPWECLLSFITSSANNVPRITSLMHRLCRHFTPALATLPLPGHSSLEAEETDVSEYTTYHLFPRPHDILRQSYDPLKPEESEERLQQTLRDLGFGYRAGFISSSIRTLVLAHGTPEERGLLGFGDAEEGADVGGVETFLASLRDVEASWRTELLALKGVGRKVADCIGLMSLDRHNVVPIDTHLQQIAARHPRFPAKLKSKATSTEGVYNAVQTFLSDLWGGQAQGDEASPVMGLAGWCQSVMFAADLKGSTAVINVKVEATTIKEEVLMKVDETDSTLGTKGLGKRNGRRILERQTESTASIVSDILDPPPALSPGQAIPPAAPTARKRKRGGKSETEERKATSTKAQKVERSRISDMMFSSKTSLSVVVERGKEPDTKVQGNAGPRLSRRSERYSVRCDKLEVGISGDSNDG